MQTPEYRKYEEDDEPLRPLRVGIIGAGLSGLSLALALRNINKQTQNPLFEFFVFEQNESFSDAESPLILLWQAGIDALRELGIVLTQDHISQITSINAQNGEQYFTWESNAKTDLEILETNPTPPLCGIVKKELIQLLLAALCDQNEIIPHVFETITDKIPELYLGCSILRLKVSATSGAITVRFSNTQEFECDVLIGADGLHSKVRDLMTNGRSLPQHASTAFIQGIAHLNDLPQNHLVDNGLKITITKKEASVILQTNSSKSYISNNVSVGFTYIEKDRIAWNIVARQDKPGLLLGPLKDEPRIAPVKTYTRDEMETKNSQPRDSASSWLVPNDIVSTKPNVIPQPTPNLSSSNISTALPSIPEAQTKSEAYMLQLQQLALNLVEMIPNFPIQAKAIIASSEIESTFACDNADLTEDPPKSYISPNFHPGRVILIGDAAHPIVNGVHGSVGASLAIADSVVLAKLLGWAHTPHGIAKIVPDYQSELTNEDECEILKWVGLEFVRLRQPNASKIMTEAKSETLWRAPEFGFWKMVSNSFGTGKSWTKNTFNTMQNAGRVEMDADCAWPRLN